MTNLKRNSLGFIVMAAAIVLLGALGLYVQKTHASPDAVISEASASATTTVSYMKPGTATTTFQFDSNTVPSNKIQSMQPVTATALYFQYIGSSTSSTLVITPQYSNNNIDWYGFNQVIGTENGSTGSTTLASTTLAYTFTAAGTATTSDVILLPAVPTLHERVVFTQTGANGAVYSETDLKSSTL